MRERLLGALARASGGLARVLRQLARRLEAIELAASPPIPELLAEDLILEVGPPPIPAAARLRPTPLERPATAQERAWQDVVRGRHPGLATRRFAQPVISASTAVDA